MATSIGVDTSTYTYNEIFSGNHPAIILTGITIKLGQNLVRGTCLAKKTSDGKYYKWAQSASDGTQTLLGVLVDDCNATSVDQIASMYVHGEFEKSKLVATATITAGWYNGAIMIKEAV